MAGIYPLLPDETCWLLAIDFDKSGWREDAAACLETSRQLNLPAALERSRSGSGAHLWFFFEEPIPAALARRLGSHVLTETMERRPQLGLDSYDRLVPNQDTMPQGGFGNLIALPLQKAPRDQENSVFLDDDLQPWADQWACLARLRRLSREQVDTGALAATTAFGKTVIGAWLIAERRVSTLVHRRQLLDQWIERLAMFLGMPADAIGRIGGGRRRPTGLIDVAVMQSLVRKGVVTIP